MSAQDQIKKLMERDLELRSQYKASGDVDLYLEHTDIMERIVELRLVEVSR